MGLFSGLLGHGTTVDPKALAKRLDGILLEGEAVELAFLIIRDFFVFTERRMIMVDVQGITGSKVDYMSVPYRAIVRYSVETSGTIDLDAEIKIWVSGSPNPIEKSLKKGSDIRGIQRALTLAVCK